MESVGNACGNLQKNIFRMMKGWFYFPVMMLFLSGGTYAQKMSAQDYISTYKNEAVENMKLKKIPASITLAQGLLESGNGNSDLAVKANNHFGIKCHKEWKGETFHKDDDAPNECFRKYKTVLESYKDHADFLSSRDRYKTLFELHITDYKGWARGLKAAGYATSPTYADKLIEIIEKYELFKYDILDIDEVEQAVTQNDVPANNTGNTQTQPNHTNASGTAAPSTEFEILYINGIRAVKVKKGQTKAAVALAFNLKEKQVEKYNELGAADELTQGNIIFVEPKKYSAEKGKETHTVKKGETFYSIAQQYGIKTESLMKKNKMWYGSELKEGTQLKLRGGSIFG